MLEKPRLASCADRNLLPKEHPSSGTPEEWFANPGLETVGLLGITFDFFINWSAVPGTVTPVIWIKRLLSKAYSYIDFMADLDNQLAIAFGTAHLKRICSFAAQYGLTLQFVIFKDEQDWNSGASEICMVSTDTGKISFTAEIISLEAFKTLIRQYSGGQVSVGPKGLVYGTSRLECALSHTNSAYPGDMDLLVLNGADQPVMLLELKKHTLDSQMSAQQLSNYYPGADSRKYNRLALFRNFLLKAGQQIPILIVYYPTLSVHTQWKLELLKGEAGALKTDKAKLYDLPVGGDCPIFPNILSAVAKNYYQAGA